ncbi:MAG: dihydroorotate dehydrogenase [Acholeplasmataceae bacterium]|nr:dihydroorotate dehydrogenase [Acholeplasmataceae bacterium]
MGKLKVDFLGMSLDNPIIPASGTFGFGLEFARFYDLNLLGSFTTKAITIYPRFGNKTPRIAETTGGLLNAIGLQNPGVDHVVSEIMPKIAEVYHKQIIANVAGRTFEEYLSVIEKLNSRKEIGAYEINISCPNVASGGMAFGVDPEQTSTLIRKCKQISAKPLIVKLSPNVTDIVLIARAAEVAGADALSLINTLLGMAIDRKTRRPVLGNLTGGLSGPAIKPVAIRMVYQVYKAVQIPIIGMGGVMNAEDVLDFILAGATCVGVGSANLRDPLACKKIIDRLPKLMEELGWDSINSMIGGAHENSHHRL